MRIFIEDSYDMTLLLKAFDASLQQVTPEDITRFERLVATLDKAHPQLAANPYRKSYGSLLCSIIMEDRLEDFQTLLPLVEFGDGSPYFVWKMLDHARDKAPFSEFIQRNLRDHRVFFVEYYEARRLRQAFDASVQQITAQDVARFGRLIAALERAYPELESNAHQISYSKLLIEMFEKCLLEDFKALFPLVSFDRDIEERVHLMLRCVGEKAPFAEFLMSLGFNAKRFMKMTRHLLESWSKPDEAIDFLEWLALRDPTIAAKKKRFYSDLIVSTMQNWEINEEKQLAVVMRLVSLGAIVDHRVLVSMNLLMEELGYPGFIVNVFEALAETHVALARRKDKVYQRWIYLLLQNKLIQDELCVQLIRRLILCGAAVDGNVIDECRRIFPLNEKLHDFLHYNINSFPDGARRKTRFI
jgi:hypothetical protein